MQIRSRKAELAHMMQNRVSTNPHLRQAMLPKAGHAGGITDTGRRLPRHAYGVITSDPMNSGIKEDRLIPSRSTVITCVMVVTDIRSIFCSKTHGINTAVKDHG